MRLPDSFRELWKNTCGTFYDDVDVSYVSLNLPFNLYGIHQTIIQYYDETTHKCITLNNINWSEYKELMNRHWCDLSLGQFVGYPRSLKLIVTSRPKSEEDLISILKKCEYLSKLRGYINTILDESQPLQTSEEST